MIELINSGKTFNSLEKLKNTKHITEVRNEEELIKQINKGNKVYAYINPYDDEMSQGEDKVLCWSLNKEESQNNYDISNDEI